MSIWGRITGRRGPVRGISPLRKNTNTLRTSYETRENIRSFLYGNCLNCAVSYRLALVSLQYYDFPEDQAAYDRKREFDRDDLDAHYTFMSPQVLEDVGRISIKILLNCFLFGSTAGSICRATELVG